MLKRIEASKTQWALLGCFALLLCMELLYFALQMSDRPKLLTLLGTLFALGLIAVLVIFYLLKASTLRIETVFLVCLAVAGVLYLVTIGPLKSNDETAHYIGAYWLSNLFLGIDPSSIQMRADDLAFYEKWADQTLIHTGQFPQLLDGFTMTAGNADLVSYQDSTSKNVLNSPIQMYLFPSLGLSFGRLLGLGSVPAYYLGRLLAFASFCAAAYVAVRNTPIGKPVFMIIALLPMSLELSSSFSYDGPTIALALLLSAFCFKAIYAEEQSKSTMAVIFATSILLVPLKVVYSTIILMTLLIPNRTFPSRRFAIAYKSLLFVACAITFFVTQLGTAVSLATSDHASYSVRASYESYSIYDLTEHPFWAAHVFLNSFFERFDFKLLTYFGAYMGQVNLTPVGSTTVAIAFMGLMIFALITKDGTPRPAARLIVLGLVCFALSSFALELTMFIGNAERGSDVIIGVLGRYFIPLTPLLIPLFANCRLSRSYPTPKVLLFGAFCLNVFYAIDIYGFIALA